MYRYLYYILGFEQVNGRFYCHKILDFTFNGTPRINELLSKQFDVITMTALEFCCDLFSNMSKREKK